MKLKIPLPDMMTQCEIASTLQSHDNIIVALLRERDRLIEIKRGLMQKLLSGEVRV
jgi:type I restriction enzyme S subunit